MNPKRIIILLLFCLVGNILIAQNNLKSFTQTLDSISATLPALNQRVDFTVNEVPLHEFIRGIAYQAGLNVNLDTGLTELVSNNFSNVRVKDLLVFIHDNFEVEVALVGNILNIKRKPQPDVPQPPPIIIKYSDKDQLLSIEVNSAPIDQVAREITRHTGKNVIITPGVSSIMVRSFIKEMPFFNALDKLAVGNNFKVSKTEDGFFMFEPQIQPVSDPSSLTNSPRGRSHQQASIPRSGSESALVQVYRKDSIDVKADNGDMVDLLLKVFEPLNIPYHFLNEINEQVTIDVKGITLDRLLGGLFAGTKTSFRKSEGIYWIGAREMLEMQVFEMVQFKYRTIDSLVYIIPKSFKEGIEIKEYAGLNSLVLAGPEDRVASLTRLLKELDQVIPVILIEVMIVDNKDSRALTTGITAGLADNPVKTTGNVLPSINMTLGSEAINSLIDGFNGFGWVNLGKVNPNFYAKLQAMEEDGTIEMRSTPQLSTLNGHKATMSIGKTEYYKEELNLIYGSVTSSSQTTTTYKPVEAEFKLEIRPIVSGNQEVTLDISVEQSDFSDRIEKNAPPGKVSRKFKSLIRIKDQEMILLGGLEEVNNSETSSGLPLVARIPILKWLFSSKSKTKSKSRLNIFIKPTILG
jgi:type IV pilus assembly protein PilQ